MLFCGEEPAAEGDVRAASTMDVDSRVRSVAHKLGDFNLISKLSNGDMITLGTKYHANCLAALYNRAREHDKEKSCEKNSQAMTHSVALAERICQIQDSRNEQPHTTVFKLSDLKKEYCKRLAQQGVAEETQEINSTRLKEKLMAAVPGLTAHTKGREVLLAFNENIGHLISDVFCEDNDADLKCLARAARIVRKEMFIETNASNGTFSSNCRRESFFCKELVHCGCKKNCGNRCKCVKADLSCTPLCICDGQCVRD